MEKLVSCTVKDQAVLYIIACSDLEAWSMTRPRTWLRRVKVVSKSARSPEALHCFTKVFLILQVWERQRKKVVQQHEPVFVLSNECNEAS
jgi:hypothetical protein